MSAADCHQPLDTPTLVAYWLDELDAGSTAALESHLFACASCHARLEHLVTLGMATRELVQQGRLAAVLTPAVLTTFKDTGLRVREYHVEAGGSVNCTVAPDDDLVVSHLRAPLGDIRRIDLVHDDFDTATSMRLRDISFDPRNNAVVVMHKAAALRRLQQSTLRTRLYSIDERGEHLLGEYTFHHARHPGLK